MTMKKNPLDHVLQMFDKKAEAETKPAATEPKKRFSIRKPKVKE